MSSKKITAENILDVLVGIQQEFDIPENKYKKFLKTVKKSIPKEISIDNMEIKEKKVGPKKPLSSYLYFSKEVRKEITESNKGVNSKDISKIIGKKWTSLGSTEKKKYEDMAAVDNERYLKEVKETSGPEVEKKPSKTNAYRVFCGTQRKEIIKASPDMDKKEIVSQINTAWKKIKVNPDGPEFKKFKKIADEFNKKIESDKEVVEEVVEEVVDEDEEEKPKPKVIKKYKY